ncbi:MAG: pyridoxal phosphate-dependent aminotransferase [Oscillospiraceae bacterium]
MRHCFPLYFMPIGSVELREEIAKKCKAYNHLDVDPRRNIIITPGSDSGLFYAMTVFLDPGDEVLVPDPSYPSNFLNPTLMGGVTVPVPLDAANGYQFDMDAFERCVTDKTKMVLITHPNNPTTTVFRRESLEALAEFVIRHDLILVVDQAFEDMISRRCGVCLPRQPARNVERPLRYAPSPRAYGLSGLRVGYIVACDTFMDVYYGGAVNVLWATNTAFPAGGHRSLPGHQLHGRL